MNLGNVRGQSRPRCSGKSGKLNLNKGEHAFYGLVFWEISLETYKVEVLFFYQVIKYQNIYQVLKLSNKWGIGILFSSELTTIQQNNDR